MLANFTEETCTGTGDTLALAGATTDRIAFSESFSDGDLVAYVVEDSGGTIKVAGIGSYVSATDDIIRNDTWNWNGTAVDSSPSTNITLSGGTHTIKCAAEKSIFNDVINEFDYNSICITAEPYFYPPGLVVEGTTGKMRGSDDAPFIPVMIINPIRITKLGVSITTADASATDTRAAIYKSDPVTGAPTNLIVDSGNLSGASTGDVVATISELTLTPGIYWFSCKTDSTTLKTTGAGVGRFVNVFGTRRDERPIVLRQAISGAYPSTAPTSGWAGENSGMAVPIMG